MENEKKALQPKAKPPIPPKQPKPLPPKKPEIKPQPVVVEEKQEIITQTQEIKVEVNEIKQEEIKEEKTKKPLPPKKQNKKEKASQEQVLENVELKPVDEIKQDKPVKNKDKQKTQKPKKPLSKTAKIVIIASACAVAVLAIIIGIIIAINSSKKQLETPEVFVHALSNQTILSVDVNENANYYEFHIKDSENKTVVTTSEQNTISINSYLTKPGKYFISAKVIAKEQRLSSEMSQVYEYEYYVQLEAPTISLDENTLIWEPIINATAYDVYYKVTENGEFLKQQVLANGLNNLSFDVTTLSRGIFEVYVCAVNSVNSYYSQSNFSNSVAVINKENLSNPFDVAYSLTTNKLTFNLDSDCDTKTFKIYVNGVAMYDFVASEISSSYEVDLVPVLGGIEVNQVAVQAIGNGLYKLDSEVVFARVN